MYIGERKKIKAFLVNNTPKKLNFKVLMRIGDFVKSVNNFYLFD